MELRIENQRDEIARYLRRTWVTWEALRIPYNLVLLVDGLTWLQLLRLLGKYTGRHFHVLYGGQFWFPIFLFAIAANGFYLLGALVETYCYLILGLRLDRARGFLFTCGLLFSMYMIHGLAMRMWSHIGGFFS